MRDELTVRKGGRERAPGMRGRGGRGAEIIGGRSSEQRERGWRWEVGHNPILYRVLEEINKSSEIQDFFHGYK